MANEVTGRIVLAPRIRVDSIHAIGGYLCECGFVSRRWTQHGCFLLYCDALITDTKAELAALNSLEPYLLMARGLLRVMFGDSASHPVDLAWRGIAALVEVYGVGPSRARFVGGGSS